MNAMEHHKVHFLLPDPMLRAASDIARQRDISIGQLVRSALDAEIKRRTSPAKTPNRADEQLLASLRRLLARDLAVADSWEALKQTLADKGFAFHEAGGGLALHSHPDGGRLCKASELGYAYGDLMRRFGRPFPGHGHHKLAERILGKADEVEDVIEPLK